MSEETLQNEEIQEEVLITEEAVETTESETVEPVVEEHKQSRNQNAKQRLQRKLRESEQRESQLAENYADLSAKVDKLINPPAERPNRVEFESEEEYEDALFDWRTPATAPVEQPIAPQATQQPYVDEAVEENWETQQGNAEDKYSDFQEVLNNQNAHYSPIMADAIKGSSEGGEIAYYLGKNLNEINRINKLNPVDQIRAIDKLGNQFKSTTTNAPTPIAPVKNGDSPSKDVSNMSTEEYRDYRRAQMAGRR